MITAIDSNVLVGLWNTDDVLNREAKQALNSAAHRGRLLIAAPVYVEIRAMPARTERLIDAFLNDSDIAVDWRIEEKVWRDAACASHEYARRRSEERRAALPRRIAADFVIGAHAASLGADLLTFDRRTFRASFPSLRFAPESS